MTISNFELAEIAKAHQLVLPLDHIVMSDEISSIPLQPHLNIVINSRIRGQKGKHWTMLVVHGKHALHFDSYAGIPTAGVLIYAKRHNLTLCHNKFIIQSMSSTNCGLYCIALLLFLKHEKVPKLPFACWGNQLYELANNYVNLFDAEASKNDAILMKYLSDHGVQI